jgi:hypothetical protein
MNTAAAASTIANAIAIMVGRLRPVARLRLLWVAAGRAPPELTDMSQIALPVRTWASKDMAEPTPIGNVSPTEPSVSSHPLESVTRPLSVSTPEFRDVRPGGASSAIVQRTPFEVRTEQLPTS